MFETILLLLATSLVAYVIFAGADFGAGIYEFLCLTRKRPSRKELVEKAIGPIWEANHIWLILVVVILFMGFPKIFSYISTYFHIPIAMILIGITLRGTAFAFRHYDPFEDNWQKKYTYLFGLSSIWTSFWQGVTFGALLQPHQQAPSNFLDGYVFNWLTPFNLLIGIFVIAVYLFLAQSFFLGESKEMTLEITRNLKRDFWKSLAFVIISGGIVFLSGHYYDIKFVHSFYRSPLTIAMMILTSLLIIPLLWSHLKSKTNYSKVIVAAQVTLILLTVVSFKYPIIIDFTDAAPYTFENTAAPKATLTQLFYALIVGITTVLPFLIYLLHIFKNTKRKKAL